MPDDDLQQMCDLMRRHPVPHQDVEDFSQYIFDLRRDRSSKIKLEYRRQFDSDGVYVTRSHLSELITLVLEQITNGPGENLYHAFHISLLLLCRLSTWCTDVDEPVLRLNLFLDQLL